MGTESQVVTQTVNKATEEQVYKILQIALVMTQAGWKFMFEKAQF